MDVVFNESNIWNLHNEDTKEGEVTHTFVDHDQNEVFDDETNDEGIEMMRLHQ